MERLAAEGRQPNASVPLYGYRIVTKADVTGGAYSFSQVGHYLVVEEQAPVVRYIFDGYLCCGSPPKIAEELTGRQIPAAEGGPWGYSRIWSMLHHRGYCGEMEWGRQRAARHSSIRGTGTKIPCPPIIEAEQFEAVQACLEYPIARRLASSPRSVALFNSLLVCGDCGGPIVDGKYKPSKLKALKGGTYYACKTCKPTWNEVSPRPQYSTYHPVTLQELVRQEMARMLPEEGGDLVCDYILSPTRDTPAWKRRNLLLLGRTVVRVFNNPFRVEVMLGGPEASAEVTAYMGRFLISEVRKAVDAETWEWQLQMARRARE